MRFRPLLMLAAFALLACVPAARAQQQQDQKVIDDFVGSRGVSFDEPAKKTTQPSRRPPRAGTHRTSAGAKNAGGVASGNKGSSNVQATSTGAASNQNASADAASNQSASAGAGDAANKGGAQTLKASATTGSRVPIALGYTVYMKDSTGGLRAVDPAREYKAGDRIVIALEPNTEGYI